METDIRRKRKIEKVTDFAEKKNKESKRVEERR